MSRYSGKCDLYDHIMMEKTYDKGNCLVSDELECFEEFKRKTGGVIYQHHKVKVDEYNQEFVKEHCEEFDFIKLPDAFVSDTRCKSGFRKLQDSYLYVYYGKKYGSLKELNKKGVYITTEIHFNTLLDIIPYYPYIVCMAGCQKDKEHIVISNESFVDEEFKDHLEHGWISQVDYKKELQKHYLEVCREYFLKDIDKRTHIEEIEIPEIECDSDKEYYHCALTYDIDYMHDIEFVWDDGKNHPHWTSPKYCQTNIIKIHKNDVDGFLAEDIKNGTVKIKYVEKMDFERILK